MHDEYNEHGELIMRTTTKTFPYTHRHGQAATFHAWEFRTLDDNVDDNGPDKYRAFYVETSADGTKNYVSKWVSYSKDLLFKTKDALKGTAAPRSFTTHRPLTAAASGSWTKLSTSRGSTRARARNARRTSEPRRLSGSTRPKRGAKSGTVLAKNGSAS